MRLCAYTLIYAYVHMRACVRAYVYTLIRVYVLIYTMCICGLMCIYNYRACQRFYGRDEKMGLDRLSSVRFKTF